MSCLLGLFPWLPFASLLYQRNKISAFLVADAVQYGFALTCDEHVLIFVYCNAILSENGDGAIVRRFAYTHQLAGKVDE